MSLLPVSVEIRHVQAVETMCVYFPRETRELPSDAQPLPGSAASSIVIPFDNVVNVRKTGYVLYLLEFVLQDAQVPRLFFHLGRQ